MFTEWVRENRGTDGPSCWCPYDRETGQIILGLSIVTASGPPLGGKAVGVFAFDDEGRAFLELYE